MGLAHNWERDGRKNYRASTLTHPPPQGLGIARKSIRELTHVDETILMHTEIDKDAKDCHIGDHPRGNEAGK